MGKIKRYVSLALLLFRCHQRTLYGNDQSVLIDKPLSRALAVGVRYNGKFNIKS